MDYYSNQMSKLIEELSCLPGIGAKSAARLAFHLIHMPVDDVKRLASTMVEARENIKYCKECYTLTDQELCPICSNSNRDHQTIMVVGIRETLRHTKRPENITVYTTCFTEQSLRCLVSVRKISN